MVNSKIKKIFGFCLLVAFGQANGAHNSIVSPSKRVDGTIRFTSDNSFFIEGLSTKHASFLNLILDKYQDINDRSYPLITLSNGVRLYGRSADRQDAENYVADSQKNAEINRSFIETIIFHDKPDLTLFAKTPQGVDNGKKLLSELQAYKPAITFGNNGNLTLYSNTQEGQSNAAKYVEEHNDLLKFKKTVKILGFGALFGVATYFGVYNYLTKK